MWFHTCVLLPRCLLSGTPQVRRKNLVMETRDTLWFMAASSNRKRAGGSGLLQGCSKLGGSDIIALWPWWDEGQDALQGRFLGWYGRSVDLVLGENQEELPQSYTVQGPLREGVSGGKDRSQSNRNPRVCGL